MKKSVIIVNEARGAVVNESDIANAIKSSDIAAFGCDVYSTEPMPENHPYYEIKDMPNVLLTPHAAWGAYEARARCVSIIADNIRGFFSGESKNRVD
jgi:glycerate dehydrogenase